MPIEVLALVLADRWHCPPWEILRAAARDVVPFLEVIELRGQYAAARGEADGILN